MLDQYFGDISVKIYFNNLLIQKTEFHKVICIFGILANILSSCKNVTYANSQKKLLLLQSQLPLMDEEITCKYHELLPVSLGP